MIAVTGVSKSFPGGVRAVRGASFIVSKGEILVLIGLSGCGKTTMLKMINRLVEPDAGTISINGISTAQWDPVALRRNIGYVIQDIGLLPHLSIADNIAITPRLKKWQAGHVRVRTEEMMTMVGLSPERFARRYPHELSGGQKQRVGVARALAGVPQIVLMDEPFGALDPITREELQDEFLALHRTLEKTIVFVTHDIFEAVKVGDRIAVMNEGAIEQVDYPEIVMNSPANDFVRRFIGRHRSYLATYAEELAKKKKI